MRRLLAALASTGLAGSLLAAEPAWTAKIHPAVLAAAERQPEAEADYLLFLKEQADLSSAESVRDKTEKGTLVYNLLNEVAERTQPALTRSLAAEGATTIERFWIANAIRVRGPLATVVTMAQRSDVSRIDPNPSVALRLPPTETGRAPSALPSAIEPSVTLIGAPSAWARGFTGQGIVIGATDTGYRWSHEAVKAKYRGWNGASADHNFNWHEAIHSGGGVCGPNAPAPCDDDGHGTHTLGTMLGSDPSNINQVGVAPGAKWIGCRNMNEGFGTPATYMECLQWFIAPTNLANANPTPALAPHVISNSWGCPSSEGCAIDTLRLPIEAVRAAGIVVVVAAGNSGSACATISDPPGLYAASFTVGSVTSADAASSFSSRGAITQDGSNRIKPNVMAQGSSVRSSTWTSDTSYGSKSGTSMATPAVAGAVALVLSAHPELIGNVNAVQTLLEQSARRLTTTTACNGTPGTAIPNNTYGWGRINAFAALGLDDTDGDGLADWQEILAGTTGTNAASVLRVTAVDHGASGVTLSFPTVSGKRYRLQRADDLVQAGWSFLGDEFTGTGAPMQRVDASPGASSSYYRVVVIQ